jgi:hypothetical protein
MLVGKRGPLLALPIQPRQILPRRRLDPRLCLSKTSKCLSGWELYFYPNSPPMFIFFTTLLGTLSSMFRSRTALELENLALRHPSNFFVTIVASSRSHSVWLPTDKLADLPGRDAQIVKAEFLAARSRIRLAAGRTSRMSALALCGRIRLVRNSR